MLKSLPKTVAFEDEEWIAEHLSGKEFDNSLFVAWVQKLGKSNRGGGPRILTITAHRIQTVKKTKKGLDPRKQAHIVYLTKCDVNGNEIFIVIRENQDEFILKFRAWQPAEVVEAIWISYSKITMGFPSEHICNFIENGRLINGNLTKNHPPPQATTFEKFAFTFGSFCSYHKVEMDTEKFRALDSLFSANERSSRRILDLNSLGKLSEDFTLNFMKALRFSQFFHEITVFGLPLPESAVQSITDMLCWNESIDTLILCKIGAPKNLASMFTKIANSNRNTKVSKINLSGNPLGDKGLNEINNALKVWSKPMQLLDLSGLQAGHATTARFLATIFRNLVVTMSVTTFGLSENQVGNKGTKSLVDWLTVPNCSLRVLKLSKCDLDVGTLVTALLQTSSPLESLDISHNLIVEQSGLILSSVLARSTTLKELNIANSQISGHVLEAIMASILKSGVGDVYLNFSNNVVGYECALKLASLLNGTWSVVRGLIFHDCKIGFEGAGWMVKALQKHQNLEVLMMDRNVQQPEWKRGKINLFKELQTLVRVNTSLRILSVAGSHLAKSKFRIDALPLMEAAVESMSLRELNLSGNWLGGNGTRLLCEMLEKNRSLRTIFFSYNGTTIEGFEEISRCLKINRTLHSLRFASQDVGYALAPSPDQKKALELALKDIEYTVTKNRKEFSLEGDLAEEYGYEVQEYGEQKQDFEA